MRTNHSPVDRGIWKFSPSISPFLSEVEELNGERRILEAVQNMIKDGIQIRGELFTEEWIQLGDHEEKIGILRAKDFFLEKAGVSSYSALSLNDSSFLNSTVEVAISNCKIENSLIFGEGKLQNITIKDTVAFLKGSDLLSL
ncbi:MAG TPA: hypothetical protein EYP78_04815 [Candidatus Omnitrophica bacterium]|nr:hypothetical protein [Candidatus Omnitrophota bacterium]